MKQPSKALTVQDVAERLNLHTTNARKWMERTGKAFNVGNGSRRILRIREDDFEAEIEARRVSPPEPICTGKSTRRKQKVGLSKLTEAEQAACKKYGVEYPYMLKSRQLREFGLR